MGVREGCSGEVGVHCHGGAGGEYGHTPALGLWGCAGLVAPPGLLPSPAGVGGPSCATSPAPARAPCPWHPCPMGNSWQHAGGCWLPQCRGAPCPSGATLSRGPTGSWCTPNPLPGPRGSSCHFGARKGRFGQRRERRRRVVQQFLPGRYKGKTNRKRVRVRVRVCIHARVRARVHVCARAPPGAVRAAGVAAGDALGTATEPPPPSGPRGHPSTVPSWAQPRGPPWPPTCCWHRGDGFPVGRAVAAAACPEVLPPTFALDPRCPRSGLVPQDAPSQPDGHGNPTGSSIAPRKLGCSRVPGARGGACRESPAPGAGSGRGEAIRRGWVGAVTCHRPPQVPWSLPYHETEASEHARAAGGGKHPIHQEKAPGTPKAGPGARGGCTAWGGAAW